AKQQFTKDIQNDNNIIYNRKQLIGDKDYCSIIEYQMHTKYNIQEHNYKIDNLVKIQIAKINYRPGNCCTLFCKILLVLPNNIYYLVCQLGIFKRVFFASEVLPLRPKEFSELDNSLIYISVSIVEAARLQFNTLANNKNCNCKGNCFKANAFVKKQTIYVKVDTI
ncbi:4882_t:CDS:2, partial [Dentiscutata heterogama]